jgi:hypothetical protein
LRSSGSTSVLGAQEHAGQRHLEHPVPLVLVEVEHRGAAVGDRHVVDQDVHAAEGLDDGGGHLLHRVLVGHVADERRARTGRLLLHEVHGVLGAVAVQVDDGNLRALPGEPDGDRLADVAAATGDDGDLAFEPAHSATTSWARAGTRLSRSGAFWVFS